jgi:hypothetical protein
MLKVPIGYFGMRNSYCQRRWPLIVPLRSFFERLAAALDRDARDRRAGHEVDRLLAADELERDLVATAGLARVLDRLGRGGCGRESNEGDSCP